MNSLISKTRLLGIIAAILLVLVSAFATVILIYFNKRTETKKSIPLYQVHRSLHKEPLKLQNYLHKQGFSIPSKSVQNTVEKDGDFLLIDPMMRSAFHSGNIQVYVYENYHYYKFIVEDKVFWVKNEERAPMYKLYVFLTFLAIFMVLLLMYRYISGSIKPLKTLHSEILRFSNGEKGVNTKSSKTDEVGAVANAFHQAVEKIEELQNGRSLLLKTIMHELNTPLTRGKILTPMLEVDVDDKETLSTLFIQMQEHLKKLQQVDALTSDNLILQKQKYALVDIIDNICDTLYLEDEIKHNITNELVHVDFTLFSSALQNLIDNAVKYSEDKEAFICLRGKRLFIVNKSAPLKEKFSNYTTPFKREAKDSYGMGLGLFVTKEILQKHGFSLYYRYHIDKHFICIDMSI